LLVLLTFVAALPAFAQDETLPDTVTISDPGRFPEGIEWDAQAGRFLLGSLRDGSVVAVADDGTITPFIDVPEEGLSSVGLHIDQNTNRLLVAYGNPAVFSDPSAAGRAAIGIYDLETGEQLHFVDMSELYEGGHFANDLTVDADGNAYVTDTFSPVIYQVTPEGEASVFIEDERLNFINGIDFSPDGYLLVSASADASLWKIPVDDPSAISQVELIQPFGADGMLLTPEGDLIAVANLVGEDGSTRSALISVSSADDWATATVDTEFETQGVTTAAYRDGEIYAIYAMLNQMGSATPPETFDIQRIDLAAG
jgi:sugar lactone lactonase YvrE